MTNPAARFVRQDPEKLLPTRAWNRIDGRPINTQGWLPFGAFID